MCVMPYCEHSAIGYSWTVHLHSWVSALFIPSSSLLYLVLSLTDQQSWELLANMRMIIPTEIHELLLDTFIVVVVLF